MIIGIDGNEANITKRVGIGEYAYQLLSYFSKADRTDVKFVIYLKNSPLQDMPGESVNWKYKIVKPGKFWTQFGLPLNLYFGSPRPDIFFTPSHYAPRFSPVKTAISIMDLSYLHFPELFKKSDLYQLRNWTGYSVKKAVRVFTISAASEDDIIKRYDIPQDKVIVTYPGIKFDSAVNLDKNKRMNGSIKDKYKIKGNYILFVGTLQPRKNIEKLIEAFSLLLSRDTVKNKEMSLVIAGKKGWLYENILLAPKKFNVGKQVKFLEFVPDCDLEALYRNAVCFVLPSLYEGFGLPVLEAMKYGCPVIISNVSSLPEAGGNAALYVDPTNIMDIADKMEQIITDPKLREDLIEKGYKQVKKFSWEKTAKETLAVLEGMVKK